MADLGEPKPPFWSWFARELRPTRERVALSVRGSIACMVTFLALAAAGNSMLVIGTISPAFFLGPTMTSRLSELPQRLIVTTALLAASVPVALVLADGTWAVLPSVFIGYGAMLLFAPPLTRPITFLAVGYGISTVVLTGVFEPAQVGAVALDLYIAQIVALLVSTAAAELWSPDLTEAFARSLTQSFSESRARLAARFITAAAPSSPPRGRPGQLVASPAAEALRLLDALAPSRPAPEQAARLALLTAAHRVAATVARVERESLALPQPPASEPELRRLVASVETELLARVDAYIAAAKRKGAFSLGAMAPAVRSEWPRVSGLLDELLARWPASGEGPRGESGESPIRGCVDAYREMGFILRTPPEVAMQLASERLGRAPSVRGAAAPRRPRVDPRLVLGALQGATTATLAFLVVVSLHAPVWSTAVWTTALLVQPTFGATVRKGVLRLVGTGLGGVLGICVMAAFFPAEEALGPFLAVTAVVMFIADYGSRSSPQVAYGWFQVGLAYSVVAVTLAPTPDTESAVNRFIGVLLGVLCVLVCAPLLPRSFASWQLLGELSRMLRATASLLHKGTVVPGAIEVCATIAAVEREGIARVTGALRLLDEARFEGRAGGLDTSRALAAVGGLRRVSLHVAAIAEAEVSDAAGALPADARAAVARFRGEAREALLFLAELVDATERGGRPGTRARARAIPELRARFAGRLPDVSVALVGVRAAAAHIAEESSGWSEPSRRELASLLAHAERVAAILPLLHVALTETCLPRWLPVPVVDRAPASAPA